MRFYTGQHAYYCGVDLHARTLYRCVLDQQGEIQGHTRLRCDPQRFLDAIDPYHPDVVVGCECIFCWYWLADLCVEESIPVVLGHALYMKAIHGAKAKNDKLDSRKTAVLLRGGAFPMALLLYRTNRTGLLEAVSDPVIRRTLEADLALADRYDDVIRGLEHTIEGEARVHDPETLEWLRTIPGVGRILALTLLYEIHHIGRFPSVQDFSSYSRLVKSEHTSAGKRTGSGGAKIGNAHLKWAFSEAAVLFLRDNPRGQAHLKRLRHKHGKGEALSILAAKFGRSVYFMLKNQEDFDMNRFFA